ncbi:hypothetical protein [Desulfovibrio legallii]|uniref:Uncharacterized protein n=1 Tax=Desulfovibrio legallii TaxID=571438 RepID=A0A6H3FBZ4_9BACT|nr:hypothetical protein [Desulfovibrio legallii]RHH26168.1 hypothetical protein DW219_01105 [Desulfovibrio sp. AM18-2]TBH81896.1 hypothetical protein EB812_01035 [Desulfovibrio legallii]
MPHTTQSRNFPEQDAVARWPRWVAAARLDDALSAAAYEAVPAPCRAAVKTGLALACAHFGEGTESRVESVRNARLGFWRRRISHAAPWAVLAFTPDYAAAARLAAACVPAQLAGVPLVGAVCVTDAPEQCAPHPAALVSLELSGVEDVFALDQAGICRLLEECQPGPGRLVLLHRGELDAVARAAAALGLPCWQERRDPLLGLPQPDAFDLELLAFAQGSALEAALEPVDRRPPDALYLSPGAARSHCRERRGGPFPCSGAPALTPGCEGFWLHPGLDPDFFRVRRQAFGLL